MHGDVGRTGTPHEAVKPSPVKLSVGLGGITDSKPYVNEGGTVNQGRPDFLLELVQVRNLKKIEFNPPLIEKKTERRMIVTGEFQGLTIPLGST